MEQLTPILDALYAPQAWFLSQSPYVLLTIIGLMIAGALTLAGFILARLGYKPLWALVLLPPTVNVIGLWALALIKFPIEKLNNEKNK